jgi:hypothetical protein
MGSRAARAWANSEGGKVPIELDESEDKGALKPVESAAAAFKVRQLLSGNDGKNNSAAFDGFMMSKLNPLASDIVKACLPDGLAVPFPLNVSFLFSEILLHLLTAIPQSTFFYRLSGLWSQQEQRVPLLISPRCLALSDSRLWKVGEFLE